MLAIVIKLSKIVIIGEKVLNFEKDYWDLSYKEPVRIEFPFALNHWREKERLSILF